MNDITKYNLLLLHAIVAGSLSGCGGGFPFAQPLEIEQGTILEREDVDRISPGMSKSQVEQILGRPLLEHPFAENRWDYLYRYKGGDEGKKDKRLTLFFEQGRIVEVEDHWLED